MARDETHHAALARMIERRAELLGLCACAYGTGDHAGRGRNRDALARLEALLEAPPSEEERADRHLAGWSPKWRKNTAGIVRLALDLAAEGDFEVIVGPGLAAVDPRAEPRTRH